MNFKFTWLLTLFMAFVLQLSFAQEKTVTGTVTTASDGLPLPGANVVVKGTSRGTQTDFDGNYSINASSGDVLVFSYVGMKTAEIAVGTSNSYNVAFELDNALEEVVIVGYGNKEEAKLIQNVAVVKEKALQDLVVNSPDQLLQGQTSGTQIVNSSGILGSAVVIRVRGVGSLTAGSQPLIVIDGVPITDNQNTFNNGGNTGVNPLSYVNPNDIASFTVLKDASATSIYGARGANGVVLITTKKGRKGDGYTVSLDYNTSATQATDLMNVLSPDQWRRFRTDISNIQNNTNNQPQDLGLGAIGDPGTDWVDLIERTGYSRRYNVSVRGGSEKTSVFAGLDIQDQEGMAVNNDSERISVRVNVETEVKKWLKTGVNVGVTNTIFNRINVENSTFAPFTSSFLQSPLVPAFNPDGSFAPNANFIGNVVARSTLELDELKTFRVIGNAFAELKLLKDFTFRTEFGIDKLSLSETKRSPDVVTLGGSAQLLIVDDERWLITNTLNYNKTFNDVHTVSALAGINYEESLRTRSNVSGTGIIDGLRNVGSASTTQVLNGDRDQSRLYGLFTRISYDYDGKYLIEGSLRRDGSSRFGSNNRFGNFWSVAVGWELGQEKFIQDLNFFDRLAFRGSLGTVGNDRIGFFPALGLFSAGAIADNNGVSGVVPNQPANPDIKWEESRTLDLGIKSSFLNNRIGLAVNYFNKKTTDLLLNQALPPQTGFTSIRRNVGEMENRGWEFDLSATILDTENFSWTTSINATSIENELLALNDGASVDNQGRAFLTGSGSQRAIVGESVNSFYLIRYVGINSQTGDAEWLDANGNITTTPTDNDRVIVGDALPDLSGGITNTFRYKNFDLNILMNYSIGNDVLIDGLRFVDGADAIGGIGNVRVENLNFWRQQGDNAFLPSPTSPTFNTFNQRSTQQLIDGSYLRLKNVTLGYNLPNEFVSKVGLNSVRLYATATNLFTIKDDKLEGIDPEVTSDIDPLLQGETFFTAPQAQTYTFGVRIAF